jgi:hypothetical protein
MCLLDQRPLPAKPHTTPSASVLDGGDENCGRPKLTRPHDPSSESFMDDPQDFKKRSRIGSPCGNPTSHPAYGQPKDEHLTATRAAIARTTPVWLYGRLLRDAAGIPDSTRVQRRRYRFRGGCFQINPALSARPRFADSQLDGGGGINGGPRPERTHRLHSAIRRRVVAHASVDPWHEPTADPDCESGGRATLPLQVLHAPLHPTGDPADLIAGPGDHPCGHGYGASVTAVRDAMGEKDFDRAWAEGAELSTDDAIAYVPRGRGESKRPTRLGITHPDRARPGRGAYSGVRRWPGTPHPSHRRTGCSSSPAAAATSSTSPYTPPPQKRWHSTCPGGGQSPAGRVGASRPSLRPATATVALLPCGWRIRGSVGHQRGALATRRHDTSYRDASK